MEATSIKELRESVITKDDYKLLPVAVIYGANSSGKSNVLKAMAEMGHLVMTSSKMNPDESLHYEPFMLDTDSRNKPTSFEVQFLAGQARYRYGFSYDKQHIISEYLFVVPFGKHTEKQICLTSGIFAAIRYGLRGKNKHDSTDLYSLVEFVDNDGRKVRNDSSFEKDYINGRYGAIPFLGGLSYGEK